MDAYVSVGRNKVQRGFDAVQSQLLALETRVEHHQSVVSAIASNESDCESVSIYGKG